MLHAHRLLTNRMQKARQTWQRFHGQHDTSEHAAPSLAAASSSSVIAEPGVLDRTPTSTDILNQRLMNQQIEAAAIATRLLPPQLTLYVSLAFVTMLTVAETITSLFDPYWGLMIHSALLVLTSLMAAQWWGHPVSRVLTVFLLAPLIRLLSLSLPLAGFAMSIWWLTISVPIFVAVIITVRTLQLSWYDIGHHLGRGPPMLALLLQMLIASAGLAFGYIEYHILQPAPMVESLTWANIWFPSLVLVFCTGYLEELLFRGVMQYVTRETIGPWLSNLLVSLIFAALHIGYLSLDDYIFVFCASMFFGWIYEHTRSLLGITLAHGLTNVMLFIVLPRMLNKPPIFELPL
jgi:hypothetical protein